MIRQLLYIPDTLFFLNEKAFLSPVAQNDILKNRQRLNKHEVLVYHAYPEPECMGRRFNPRFLAAEVNLPLRWLVETRKNIHKRTLAGTIFTEKGVNLSLHER